MGKASGCGSKWGDRDTGSKSQSDGNLGNGGKDKEWLYRHMVS